MSHAAAPLDADALRYQDHWQPVLDAAAQRLLDRVTTAATQLSGPDAGSRSDAGPRPRLLDIGAGTGALTLVAARRWPDADIIGLDASAAMLSVARERLSSALGGDTQRTDWIVADADSVPLDEASIDVAVSSFVLQLVDDRRAVLREIHRLLRPGGLIGFVTWTAEELQMAADVEFDEAVYELELDDPESVFREPKPGDYESVERARTELLEAGYDDVDARPDQLTYAWTRDSYLRFKEAYDERELFESLAPADRERLRGTLRRRWGTLSEDDFTLRAPLVTALARRR